MMKMYVIGSCRVHGPLSKVPGYSRGLRGYTHGIKEAIQHVKYVRGAIKIPTDVMPLIVGSSATVSATRARAALNAADVVVVEVSTGKVNEYNGLFLQDNYLRRHGRPEGVSTYMQDYLEQDIKELKHLAPNLVIIQHIEIEGIRSRSEFAATLRAQCAAQGVPVYNPTPGAKMIDAYHYDPATLPEVAKRMMEFIQCYQ